MVFPLGTCKNSSRYCVQFWTLYYKKGSDQLEGYQGRPPRWWWLEHLPCEERLAELGLFSLEQRKLWGDLTAVPVPVGRP